jgi:glycerophosphoryl diester phosphodiesterase
MVCFDDLRGRFFVVAHRGASAYRPENTLSAFKLALDFGVDAVEMDVRVTADGKAIIMHDETVDRTTNGRGRVVDLTWDYIRGLKVGLDERVPLLSEALDLVGGKCIVFLELKVDEAVEPAVREVDARGLWDSVLFTSFEARHLTKVLEYNRRANVGLIYIKPMDGILGAKKIGAKIALPYHRLATAKAIEFAHKLKLMIAAWTVDDYETALELKNRGIDGIVSNKPDVIMKLKEQQ